MKAPVLKTGRPARVSWVRIPPHPPIKQKIAIQINDFGWCVLFYPKTYPRPAAQTALSIAGRAGNLNSVRPNLAQIEES